MQQILNSASTAIRQAQLHAPTSVEQDRLGVALDFIEGELPNLLDLVHDLIAAYSELASEPDQDRLLTRARQVVERVEGMSWGHILAAHLAVDEIEE
ncbi:MAG: hypothetical protein HY060_03685 [Proteobacteria bacterium]|nr:hypothetical protein [Pseudomonadota bacterium]